MDDWRSFRFELRFAGDTLQADLINIEAYRLSLNRLLLPQQWRADLQKLFIVRAVHGTTAIEGNPLSEGDVSRQLAQQGQKGFQDQVHLQTQNAAEAFRWVEQNFSTQRLFRLEDILTIHKLLTTGSDEHENAPGRLRESGHNVTVGSPQVGGVHHPPPGGEMTSRLVNDFLEFINSRRFRGLPIVIQALGAHFYFVTLHPFGNGNGRTTRCIEAAILHSGGYNTYGFYCLSNYFYRNRDAYFQALQEARTKHRYDLTAFLSFGLKGFLEELERINSYVRNRTHRLQYREMIRRCMEKRIGKRRRLLNEREAQVLHRILDASKPADPFSDEPAREATWDDIHPRGDLLYRGKSVKTVVRELIRLEELGFISAVRDESVKSWTFLVRFDAIELY